MQQHVQVEPLLWEEPTGRTPHVPSQAVPICSRHEGEQQLLSTTIRPCQPKIRQSHITRHLILLAFDAPAMPN